MPKKGRAFRERAEEAEDELHKQNETVEVACRPFLIRDGE